MVLFALGFVLGTVRVMIVAPRYGELSATWAEIPVMLIAAIVTCRWALQYWQVPRAIGTRWIMVIWFLALLVAFETALGAGLFGRSLNEQFASLITPAGLLGLSAQIIAALLPLYLGNGKRRDLPE